MNTFMYKGHDRCFSKVVLLYVYPTLFLLPCIDHKLERSPRNQIAVVNYRSLIGRYHQGREADWWTASYLVFIKLAEVIV